MKKSLALIIEDDPHLNDVFSLTLKADFEILSVTDGLEALALLSEKTPSLVVLDMNLPGASGSNILAYIRAEKRLTKTRVILATADAIQADLMHGEADLVLLKPVSPVQLRELASRLDKKL